MTRHEYRDCPMFVEHPDWPLCRAARYTGSVCLCDALIDTDFDKDCPFYKTVQQFEADESIESRPKIKRHEKPAKIVIKPHWH